MQLNVQKRPLPSSQYYPEVTRKTAVVLHFTAGSSVAGAYMEWVRTPARIGTSYILGLDGVVCEVFSEKMWAYHLGLKGEGWEHGLQDQRTIGIEVVNVGPLQRLGDKLCWWPKNFQQPYCGLAESGKYVHVPSWRGFEYFATFPEPQMAALRLLVDEILERNSIPRMFLAPDQRLVFHRADIHDFTGILTHCNFRADKFDIGPAFNWPVLE